MTTSDQQSPFDQYLVPLAVCVPVCVAAFFYMKNSMTETELPPLEENGTKKSSSSTKKTKKDKKKSNKSATTAVEKEVVAENPEEQVESEEEKPVPKKGKTGAQKRREKKEKDEAEKKVAEKVEKKGDGKKSDGKKKQPVKVQPAKAQPAAPKVIEEEWNVVTDEKKVKGTAQKVNSEPAVEEAKPSVSDKQKKKAAKDRAEQQRKNAKKNDHLANLPEEVLAQMAKFNAPAVTSTTAVFNDEWTDIAVRKDVKPKKVETVEFDADAPVENAPVRKTRAPKVTIYRDASQAEIFKQVGDRKDDELAKYTFKGLDDSW